MIHSLYANDASISFVMWHKWVRTAAMQWNLLLHSAVFSLWTSALVGYNVAHFCIFSGNLFSHFSWQVQVCKVLVRQHGENLCLQFWTESPDQLVLSRRNTHTHDTLQSLSWCGARLRRRKAPCLKLKSRPRQAKLQKAKLTQLERFFSFPFSQKKLACICDLPVPCPSQEKGRKQRFTFFSPILKQTFDFLVKQIGRKNIHRLMSKRLFVIFLVFDRANTSKKFRLRSDMTKTTLWHVLLLFSD